MAESFLKFMQQNNGAGISRLVFACYDPDQPLTPVWFILSDNTKIESLASQCRGVAADAPYWENFIAHCYGIDLDMCTRNVILQQFCRH